MRRCSSLGVGYQWGNASSAPIDILGRVVQGGNGVTLHSISILYAISYSF